MVRRGCPTPGVWSIFVSVAVFSPPVLELQTTFERSILASSSSVRPRSYRMCWKLLPSTIYSSSLWLSASSSTLASVSLILPSSRRKQRKQRKHRKSRRVEECPPPPLRLTWCCSLSPSSPARQCTIRAEAIPRKGMGCLCHKTYQDRRSNSSRESLFRRASFHRAVCC